jgi:hypothetical protein
MVSTRTKTDSLPTKKPTFAEEQATAAATVRPKKVTKSKDHALEVELEAAAPEKSLDQAITSKAAATAKTPKPKATKSKKVTQDEPPILLLSDELFQPPEQEGATTFLDLPPELRNEIYSYMLVRKGVVEIKTVAPYVLEPALLAVNRQIRSEALTIFYGENTFQIAGSTLITKFLRTAGEEKIRALRDVKIYCMMPNSFSMACGFVS